MATYTIHIDERTERGKKIVKQLRKEGLIKSPPKKTSGGGKEIPEVDWGNIDHLLPPKPWKGKPYSLEEFDKKFLKK